MDRQQLFEELDAWNPRWQKEYRTLPQAVAAANCQFIQRAWDDYIQTPEGIRYLEVHSGVFDTLGAIEACRKAEEDSPAFQEAYQRFTKSGNGVSWE